MSAYLLALLISIFVVFTLLVFYVAPGLAPVVYGPTGATGPVSMQSEQVSANFFDGLTPVASDIPISLSQIGPQVVLTCPGFTFNDAASSITGEIATTAIVPTGMRPATTVNMMVTTISSERKIGMAQVTPSGVVAIYVNAQVDNLVNGDAWAASSNAAGNFSIPYTTF
jgi:hypothetical protein